MPSEHYTAIVQAIIEELQKVNEEGIALSEQTDITTDLHVDSLAVMELVFELEERFDVSIPLNELADMRTVGEIASLVESKRMEKAA